ncbi:unnamed protein product [Cladocopium goreaui]|uniref:Uncharacterized protein n=1 Tax=Cladocopium goreaui TaxID=2562237 RepID=A0A9P1DS38_9DINO|nr:unnamed protein product [Cladocopium goreaui]
MPWPRCHAQLTAFLCITWRCVVRQPRCFSVADDPYDPAGSWLVAVLGSSCCSYRSRDSASDSSMVQLERYRLDQAEAKTLELKRHKAAVAAMVRPTSEAAKAGGSIPWPLRPAQTRAPADRRLFRETFEAFRSKDATGLSAEGFTKLCQHCFLLTKTFGLQDAQQLFWEVTLPGTEMDLNCFEAALSLIAWRTRRSSEHLRRAVILAGFAENCEKVWHIRAETRGAGGVVDNETCILGEGTCHLDWPGELVIPEKRQMMCPSVALTADRFVMKSDSTISTKSTIKIHARTMTFNKCVLTSGSTFLREKDHSACEGIQVMNTELIVQHKLVMKCQDGTVNVTGKSALQAGSNMSLRAKFVSFPDFYVKLFGGRINISAEQLHLGASMGGTPDLVAMAQYEATLGWLGGTWTLGSLVAAAETLSFAMDHRVEVLGTSCDNQELPRRHDYCQELLHSWPWSEKTLGDALSWVPGVKPLDMAEWEGSATPGPLGTSQQVYQRHLCVETDAHEAQAGCGVQWVEFGSEHGPIDE